MMVCLILILVKVGWHKRPRVLKTTDGASATTWRALQRLEVAGGSSRCGVLFDVCVIYYTYISNISYEQIYKYIYICDYVYEFI